MTTARGSSSPARHRAGGRRAAPRPRRRLGWVVAATGVVVVLVGTTGLGVLSRPAAKQPVLDDASASLAPQAITTPGDERAYDALREVAEATQPRRAKDRSPTPDRASPVPESGSGAFDIAAAPAPAFTDVAATITYQVEVERDLDFRPDSIARTVDATLADPRGWGRGSAHRLSRVSASGDLRVVLATPQTADELCAPLATRGRLSCRNGNDVVINAWRWVNGSPGYRGNIADYRRYVINHEVGHGLGFAHVGCPAPGRLAPVMLQQTLGLDGCRPNPWPARVDLAG